MRESDIWVDFPSLMRTQASPTCHAVVQLGMRDFPQCSVPDLLLTSENLAEHIPVLDGGLSEHCILPALPILCPATCNSYLSVSESDTEGKHACFGGKVIELLI